MRGAEYIPVANIPIVDLGAQYEAAKARREESEARKLEYLNQFKQVRGSLSEGVRPAVQQRWNQVESLLDQGDMSFEGRKKLQQAYKDYAEYTAQGVDFTRALDEREAEVLSNPEKYNLQVLKDLDAYRTERPDDAFLTNPTFPSLTKYIKYQPKKMSSSAMAESAYNNLKAFDGLDNLRNADGTINEVAFNNTIDAQYLGLNSEQLDAIYAEELSLAGGLDGSLVESVDKIRSLSDEDEKKYLASHAQRTGNRLRSSLSKDVYTKAEERADAMKDAQAKALFANTLTRGNIGLQQTNAIALENLKNKNRQGSPAVDASAALSGYLQQQIGGDKAFIITKTEDGKINQYNTSVTADIVQNLSGPLSKIGFTVTKIGNSIKITNPDNDSKTIAISEKVASDPKVREKTTNDIIFAVMNNLPVMDEDQAIGGALYLNNLYKSGVISAPSQQAPNTSKYNK
jgi:hypothetical protein